MAEREVTKRKPTRQARDSGAGLSARVAELEAKVAQLEERVTALAARPTLISEMDRARAAKILREREERNRRG